jgi:predicted RNA-binding Zn-ribbon protein involved in translation (DUF1610 family)
VYRLLRAEDLCHGEEQGASGCPLANTVTCVACQYHWVPESTDVNVPGPCPSCGQEATVAERCESCPVVEVEHQRADSSTGRLLERVLEHDFDCKHYRLDPGTVSAEIREGLKVLESERTRWERESREKAEQEREERQRVQEMQRRGGRF